MASTLLGGRRFRRSHCCELCTVRSGWIFRQDYTRFLCDSQNCAKLATGYVEGVVAIAISNVEDADRGFDEAEIRQKF